MNFPSPEMKKTLQQYKYFLVTDIDGTLTGDEAALSELVHIINKNRSSLGFGLASGRYLESMKEIVEKHNLPQPDLFCSSVGTEIYYGNGEKDQSWHALLNDNWNPEKIRKVMESFPFCTLQKEKAGLQDYKISYLLEDSSRFRQVQSVLEEAGIVCSVIFSQNTYLDILPDKADKGKALEYIIDKINIPENSVITAGDSGNDFQMLDGLFRGIVVGNYKPELEVLKEKKTVYFAEKEHAAGVIEGIKYFLGSDLK